MGESASVTNLTRWLECIEPDSGQSEPPSSDQRLEILEGHVRQLRLSEATMLFALESAKAEFKEACQESQEREQRLFDLAEKIRDFLSEAKSRIDSAERRAAGAEQELRKLHLSLADASTREAASVDHDAGMTTRVSREEEERGSGSRDQNDASENESEIQTTPR
jgi:hypothetical protein